jgi:hypothetical protein
LPCRTAFKKFFGIGNPTVSAAFDTLKKGVNDPNFDCQRRVSRKDRRVMGGAIHAWLEASVHKLAEPMPHTTAGGGSRSKNWRNGTMEAFRDAVLAQTVAAVKREQEREESGAIAAAPTLAIRKPAAPPNSSARRGVKRQRSNESDSDREIMLDPAAADSELLDRVKAVKEYHEVVTTHRFSCMTRRALFDLLIQEIRDGSILRWPEKLVKESDSPPTWKRVWREPSVSYFNKILHEIANISFYKNPTFTKCNTCVTLRNMARQRCISQTERDDIRYARSAHCFFIMSEVGRGGSDSEARC